MENTWWYDYSDFSYDDVGVRNQTLYLRRLTVNDDGSAEILFTTGYKELFTSEDEAILWLGDEENWRLSSLLADLIKDDKPVDPRIVIPIGEKEAEIVPQMIIYLYAKK